MIIKKSQHNCGVTWLFYHEKDFITLNLTNHFLIAMPHLDDLFFEGGVVYVCEHNEDSAMGLVINKPSPLVMDQLFDAARQPTPERYVNASVYMGGPMQIDRGFLIHTPIGNWQSSLLVTDEIALTTSKDIISGMQQISEVGKTLATIGYASWEKGQLESEIANNDWLVVEANQTILFDCPVEERYEAALGLLGIKPESLMMKAGHA
jgi:putative transcriptional regulator